MRQSVPATRIIVVTDMPIEQARTMINAVIRDATIFDDRPRYVKARNANLRNAKQRYHERHPDARRFYVHEGDVT